MSDDKKMKKGSSSSDSNLSVKKAKPIDAPAKLNKEDSKSKDPEISLDEKEEPKQKKKDDPLKKLNRANKVVNTVQAAGKANLILKFLLYMRMLMLNALAAVRYLFASIINAVVGFFSSVFGAIAAVASYLGVPVPIAIAFLGVSFTATSVIVVGIFIGSLIFRNATNSSDPNPCKPKVEQAQAGLDSSAISTQTMLNAKSVYAVLKTYGLSDYNIAGVIANWACESGIDPTSVETIFTEPHIIGEQKLKAASVNYEMAKFNPTYSNKHPSIQYMGIGLGQWTNGRHTLLMNFAKTSGKPWYDLGTQLAFAITPAANGGDSGSVFFLKWAPEASPDSAAETFMRSWEGLTPEKSEDNQKSLELRKEKAIQYSTELLTWELDSEYANGIIAMTNSEQRNATDVATGNAKKDCDESEYTSANNGSLADAAVAYAYATSEEATGNDGTELYRMLHERIFPGDTYFQSCDRSVATAIRWAGYDDAYPKGAVATQLQYLLAANYKWQNIKWSGKEEELQPGDVLIRYDQTVSHTVLYVGNEAVRKKFPSALASVSFVSGSIGSTDGSGSRSPGCGQWNGDSTEGYQTYYVFRNIKKEANSKFIHAAESSFVVAK